MTQEHNPYIPPTSDTRTVSIGEKLLAEQNWFGTMLGCVVGSIPGFTLFYFSSFFKLNIIFYFVSYIIPGLFMGFFSGFMGRGILFRYRALSTLTSLLLFLIYGFLSGIKPLELTYLFINLPIIAYFGVRRLSREEENIMFDYKIGLKK